jgi:tRNA(fMet)-specific endonuclease VapC
VALRYLLDTNTVSYHLRRVSTKLQRRLRAIPASAAALSVVTEMEIRYGLARNPSLRIGPLDLMIASHALTLGLTLITSDRAEFRRVPDLRCEDWTR